MAETNKSYQSDVTLTSMKRAVKKAKSSKAYPTSTQDPYPYGLSISLDEDSLKKLGLDITDLTVGDTVAVHACAKVTRVSQSASEGSGKSESLELQLTDMCVEPESAEEDASEGEEE